MTKNERQPGYYWVKWFHTNEWIVAEYDPRFSSRPWFIPGVGEEDYDDSHFSEINETRILNPDEK